MIDVEAVCAEWRRLGGVCEVLAFHTRLLGEEQDDGDATAAECEPHALVVMYPIPEDGEGVEVTSTAEVLAALPALAKAWGVTKDPEGTMKIEDMTDDEIEAVLRDRKSHRMQQIVGAVALVHHWAQQATTDEFRTVVRDTGGLSVGWGGGAGREQVTIEWASEAMHKRCLGL